MAAVDAGLADGERFGLDKAGIENGIHRPAHEAVIKIPASRCKRSAFFDLRYGAVYVRFGSGHDSARLVRLRRIEHDDVVLRHDDLRRAHAGQPFFPAERPIVLVGVADLAAAGHDEPRLLCARQLRAAQPIPHKAGNAPGVGRRDDDQPPACFHR